jgi:hypothetical protein
MKPIDDKFDYLQKNTNIFLNYMKVKYPLYHNSNVFLRDLQYGIKNFFAKKEIKLSYTQIEKLAEVYIRYLEESQILIKLKDNTWKLNYPEQNSVINTNPEQTTN